MADASKAVFLSYASQDAEAAARICEALRAAGVEVWFDQSELRGGDAWDLKIHQQIQDCALFIPIISANTASRPEGYFRLEWGLADHRTERIARNKAFVVPVCIDRTPDSGADVPESFHRAQWTRLPGGETPASFCNRIAMLLGGAEPAAQPQSSPSLLQQPRPKPTAGRWRMMVAAAALVVVVAIVIAWQSGRLKAPRSGLRSAPAASSTIAAAAPQKSIAVLPFLDMSEKKDQEYFSDGLSEQLIDLLTKIPALRVPARTSSFYFKGKSEDIATIAARLHVSHVLEGSVRKSGNKLRVTAQLIRADNGYHLWSETYDRKWDDVFRIQDDIAAAVVKALSVSLLGGALPQTVRAANSEAYALYLQARAALRAANDLDDNQRSLELLQRALKLDPDFAPAWALQSRIRVSAYEDYKAEAFQSARAEAFHDAQRAITLDPAMAEGHLAMSRVFMTMDWNWSGAEQEMQAALRLEGSNPDVLRNAYYLYRTQGRFDEGLRRILAATERDPLYHFNFTMLGEGHFYAAEYAQAVTSLRKALELYSGARYAHAESAVVRMALGQPDAALAEIVLESDPMYRANGLPYILDALGRRREAEQARSEFKAKYGERHPHYVACMFAAHGDLDQAFTWWDRAFQQHDTDLAYLKLAPSFALMPQLAADPRFKALLRRMNLPETTADSSR